LNRFRAAQQLPPVRDILNWWFSPQRVVALFPDWLAPRQADWPPNLEPTGFPMFSNGQEKPLDPEVAAFCRAGPAPVVVTFGSGYLQGREVYAETIEGCRRAGVRGILMTRYVEQLPQPLPEFMRHCVYAPFNQLFPLCSAIIHHGGIGTMSQAFAAGLPQLILPMAWDQPDNAVRVTALGTGTWLFGRPRAGKIAAGLKVVLRPAVRERCQEVARKFEKTNPLAAAVDCIERPLRGLSLRA
jgi:UDP:flavonoid glycosyltransferase YjiC (YdhE family)